MTVRDYLNEAKRRRIKTALCGPALMVVAVLVGVLGSEIVGSVLFLVGLLALLVNVAIGHRRRYFDCPFCGQRIAAAVFAPHVSPSSRLSALFRVPDEVRYCPCCAASIDQEMPDRPDRADVGGENR